VRFVAQIIKHNSPCVFFVRLKCTKFNFSWVFTLDPIGFKDKFHTRGEKERGVSREKGGKSGK